MPLPNIKYLHFLTDKDRKPYYLNNGAVSKKPQTDGASLSLPQPPKGWDQIELSFGTNYKYWSLLRSFTAPFTYITDGAKILRHLRYKLRGFEEEIYCLLLKWNPDNGKYQEEYFGRIDMLLDEDEPSLGVNVSTKEGGLHSFLTANDGVTYELPCDATNPDAVKVQFDGVELFDNYNFGVVELQTEVQGTYTIPMYFKNNEGDSIGIIRGDQHFEKIQGSSSTFNDYFRNSANYSFAAANNISITVSGELILTNIGSSGGIDITAEFFTSRIQQVTIIPIFTRLNRYETRKFPFSFTLNLLADERLFFTFQNPGFFEVIKFHSSNVSISFKTINPPSSAYGIPIYPLLKQLTSKLTDGRFTADSNYFKANNNIVFIGGQSLRELKNAILKTSFQDFFEDNDCDFCLGMKIVNNVLWIEPKTDLYKDGTEIFNVGPISNLKIGRPDDLVVNTVKFGSPVQDYNERNGKHEFNDTKEWKLPVTAKKAELTKAGKYRRDSYGMEFIRGKLNNKETTDNKGDNEVFKVDAFQDNEVRILAQLEFSTNGFTGAFTGVDFAGKFTIAGTSVNDGTYTLLSIVDNGTNTVITTKEATQAGYETNATFTFHWWKLNRSITIVSGVPTNTVYNTSLTPANAFRNWMPYFNSILFQQKGEKITFQTGDKNKELITLRNGVTIREKADIQVGDVALAFFLPFDAEFDCRLPVSFSKLKNTITGHIEASYNGFPLWFLPIGEMKSRPVQNEASNFRLIFSTKTSLDTLLRLSTENLVALDTSQNFLMMSILNPVHFVYYGKELNPKYHYKDTFDDWLHHRNMQYAEQPHYIQKWQKTDKIDLQIITRNIGNLELYVYDVNAIQVAMVPFVAKADAALQLPYIKKELRLDLSTYNTGRYLFVVKSVGQSVFVSEWQEVFEDLPDTFLFQYSHSTSKQSAYWATFAPMMRIEAMFEDEVTKTSSSDYVDEPGNKTLLEGQAYYVKKLHIGKSASYAWGIPEWMERKLANIFLLDNLQIEESKYVKEEGDFEGSKINGWPLRTYTIDMRYANNENNLSVEGLVLPGEQPAASATIDAEAFGQGSGVITVELP